MSITSSSANSTCTPAPNSTPRLTPLSGDPSITYGEPGIEPNTLFAGHPAWRVEHTTGTLIISQLGGQVLSWTPHGQRDAFWLSPLSKAPATSLRGGVPICWPWFAKQNMPSFAPQHGLVRKIPWVMQSWQTVPDRVILELRPNAQALDQATALHVAALRITQRIELSDQLHMQLITTNLSDTTFPLTQAMHSYFAVSDAAQIQIDGLEGKPYLDKLADFAAFTQQQPFAKVPMCDRIYHQLGGSYRLIDPLWQRSIEIRTQSSQSLVVWNPGQEGMAAFTDMHEHHWREFYCLEAANASPDTVHLQAGATHTLTQSLKISQIGG